MAFLRNKDFYSLIQEDNLDVILGDNDNLLQDRIRSAEAEAASYLRHRYDVDKIFASLLSYSATMQYYEGNIVEWTETAYDSTATYNTDDRCSYSGYIYEAKEDGVTGTWDSSKWTQLAENESIWTCKVPSLGDLPSDNEFAYSDSAYLTDFKYLTGWDRENITSLYFKRIDDYVYMYISEANRTANTNSYGRFVYDETGLDMPHTVEVLSADNDIIKGEITIKQYIDDDATFAVTVSNHWELKDSRDQKMVEILIDIALYHVHSRINPRNIPDLRRIRYDGDDANQRGGAIGMLKMIRDGKNSLDIPIYTDKNKGSIYQYGNGEDAMNLNY